MDLDQMERRLADDPELWRRAQPIKKLVKEASVKHRGAKLSGEEQKVAQTAILYALAFEESE